MPSRRTETVVILAVFVMLGVGSVSAETVWLLMG